LAPQNTSAEAVGGGRQIMSGRPLVRQMEWPWGVFGHLSSHQEKSMATATAPKPPTKSELLNSISQATELSRKQVSAVFDALAEEIKKAVGKKGPGSFVVPGLMKIKVVHKPATKARKGISPFTKLETVFKAKPARKVIKVRPLKSLHDMAK
jgi:nucleoid DNA-binding protein